MKNKASSRQKATRLEGEGAEKMGLDRREALSRLLGVAAAATACGWLPRRATAAGPALQHEPAHFAGATVSGFFTEQQKFTVSALAETMIPRRCRRAWRQSRPGGRLSRLCDDLCGARRAARLDGRPEGAGPGLQRAVRENLCRNLINTASGIAFQPGCA